jgi:hypothetical protein
LTKNALFATSPKLKPSPGSDSFIWLSRFRCTPVSAGLRPGSEASKRNRESNSGENRRTSSANGIVRHASMSGCYTAINEGRAIGEEVPEAFSHCLRRRCRPVRDSRTLIAQFQDMLKLPPTFDKVSCLRGAKCLIGPSRSSQP